MVEKIEIISLNTACTYNRPPQPRLAKEGTLKARGDGAAVFQ
jgi:hypothetical protein